MKQVVIYVSLGDMFYKDFYDRYTKTLKSGDLLPTLEQQQQWVKEWYGYTLNARPGRTSAVLTMTDHQYTLFMLKYR